MAQWDRYRSNVTSFRVRARRGGRWIPRFYCDDSTFQAIPQNLWPYTKKAPAVKFSVTPLINPINQSFNWDISSSNSATSTIEKFSVFFNGPSTPGDLVDQLWASAPKTGAFSYDTQGEYIVEAFVEDILGTRSQTASIRVQVTDFLVAQTMVIGTTDKGVYRLDPGGSPQEINDGLTGGYLQVRHAILNPYYKFNDPGDQHIWLATASGLAYSTDGGQDWDLIPESQLGVPENAFNDVPAPTETDPDNINIAFDPQSIDRIYLLRTTLIPNLRTWLYWSDDYGQSWLNEAVVTP